MDVFQKFWFLMGKSNHSLRRSQQCLTLIIQALKRKVLLIASEAQDLGNDVVHWLCQRWWIEIWWSTAWSAVYEVVHPYFGVCSFTLAFTLNNLK